MNDPLIPPAVPTRRVLERQLTRAGRLRSALLLTIILFGIVIVAIRDPRSYGMGVLCPTRRFLGIYCPGCGSTRAANDLLHGDVGSAIANNPAAVLFGLPLLGFLMANLTRGAFWGVEWAIRLPTSTGRVVVTALVLYGVARNVPVESLEFLRPPDYRQPTHAPTPLPQD